MPAAIPRLLVYPCNCFGHHSSMENDQHPHEMEVTPGCQRKIADYHKATVRQFDTGATRDTAEGKLDYDGFLSPLVLHCYAVHMMNHQKDSSGEWRESDNWQKGIPMAQYIKSMWRHFFDVWSNHRRVLPVRKERIIRALCALLFNVMGYLHEYLKENPEALKAFEEECGYGK